MTVVVLAGAGLSKPAGVPLASELLERVQPGLDGSDADLFQHVLSGIEAAVKPDERGTILEDVVDSLELFRIADRLGIRPWVSAPIQVDYFASRATDLRNRLAELAAAELQPTGSYDYLKPIAELARTQRVPIVTLNYDLLIEQIALDCEVSIERGLKRDNGHEVFDYYSGHVTFDVNPGIELIKLHGSVDWWEYDVSFAATLGMHRVIHTSDENPFHDYKHRIRPMILGGATKLRHEGIFPGLWARAYEVSSAADRLVIAGYSLCDDHVNELIRRCVHHHRNRQQPTIVVLELEEKIQEWWGDRDRTGQLVPYEFEMYYAGGVSEESLDAALNAPVEDLRLVSEVRPN